MEPQLSACVLLVSGLFPVVAMIVWMFKKDGPTVLKSSPSSSDSA